MQKIFKKSFIATLLAHFIISTPGKSQDNSHSSCDPAKDYSVIKKGEKKCITGNSTITYLTLEGGTLIIDGNIRINNLAIDGGKILITKKSTALLPSMTLNDVTLSNNGSVTYMGNVKLTNGNSYIINETSESKMDWGASELTLIGKNATFVNNGTATIGTLRIESKSAKVILGENSLTNVENLISNSDNRITVPQGSAKLNQTGYAQLPKSLTASIKLVICPGSASELRALSKNIGGYGKAKVLEKGCPISPIPNHSTSSVN